MRSVRLTFDGRYRHPILEQDKRATIRYEFERPIQPGDALHMVDPQGEHFATGHTTQVTEATAFDIATSDIDGHRTYAGVDDLLGHLQPFYPNAALTPNTDLTVITWRDAHEPGSHRFCELCRVPMTRTRYQP